MIITVIGTVNTTTWANKTPHYHVLASHIWPLSAADVPPSPTPQLNLCIIWGWGLQVPSVESINTLIILLVFNFPNAIIYYGRNCVCPILSCINSNYNCCLMSLVASIERKLVYLFLSYTHQHTQHFNKVNNTMGLDTHAQGKTFYACTFCVVLWEKTFLIMICSFVCVCSYEDCPPPLVEHSFCQELSPTWYIINVCTMGINVPCKHCSYSQSMLIVQHS